MANAAGVLLIAFSPTGDILTRQLALAAGSSLWYCVVDCTGFVSSNLCEYLIPITLISSVTGYS